MQIWPAIDLRGGNCVRLRQGDYGRETVFDSDPVQSALRWQSQGARQIHMVDLDGARQGNPLNRKAIESIVSAVKIPCQLGGGVRDERTIESLLAIGLSRLVVGTRALHEPDWLAEMCEKYPQKLALGVDARDGQVATNGWLQTSDVRATDFVKKFADVPLAAVVYTDIARDGMLAGPNFQAMNEMNKAIDVDVVASGGVTTVSDVRQLAQLGLAGCIIGRSLYEQKLSLPDAINAADS